MPKSRVRTKKVYTPPVATRPDTTTTAARHRPSPRWVPIVAIAFFVAGIAWLVTYYMTQTLYPVESFGYWNLAAGFGLLVIGLGVLTQWR